MWICRQGWSSVLHPDQNSDSTMEGIGKWEWSFLGNAHFSEITMNRQFLTFLAFISKYCVSPSIICQSSSFIDISLVLFYGFLLVITVVLKRVSSSIALEHFSLSYALRLPRFRHGGSACVSRTGWSLKPWI